MPEKKIKRTELRRHINHHVNPKLRRSLRIYLLVSFVVLIVVIVSAFREQAHILDILAGLIIGVIVGVLFSRIYKISWDKDANHVIKQMDIFGIVLLVVFIVFDVNRSNLVGLFVQGASVGAISLALLSGAFYGRVLGVGRDIVRVLKEQEVFSVTHKDA